MASYFEHKILSGVKSDADLTDPSNLHKAVLFNPSTGRIVLAAAGERAIGFLQNLPDVDQFAEVAVVGGGSLAIAGASVTIGDFGKVDANGDVIQAATAGDEVVCRFLKSGVDGDHVDVQVLAKNIPA